MLEGTSNEVLNSAIAFNEYWDGITSLPDDIRTGISERLEMLLAERARRELKDDEA